jgi:paraquat-inducible protein A
MSAHYHICHACDTLSKISTPDRPGRYKCPNCHAKLYTYKPGMVEKLYAYNLAALFLFIVANYFPFLSFHVAGSSSHANFATSIFYLYEDGQWLMAGGILLTTIVIPLFRILLYCILFGSLYHRYLPRYATQMLKLLESLLPWGMLDVLFLGVLVSIVKLVKMGTIIPGTSLWAFMLMILILAAAQSIFDPHQVWERIGDRKRLMREEHV